MKPFSFSTKGRCVRGFTLVEIIAVIGIIVILVGVSLTVVGNTGAAALRTAGENLTAIVEQGRTSAISRRREVALVVLEPGKGPYDDGHCRVGLFELEGDSDSGILSGRLLQRWTKLPSGIVFFGGEVESLGNVMDEASMTIEWKNGDERAEVNALVFSARGGLSEPQGSKSVVVKIGRGTYRNGSVVPIENGASRTIRIGRVVARPWIIDA